jgi:hypothetical protein
LRGSHFFLGSLLLASMAFLVSTSCRDERLKPTQSSLRFTRALLQFEETMADGLVHRAEVGVINEGRASLPVDWQQPDAPMALVDPPAILPSGETTLVLELTASVPGRFSRTLSVGSAGMRPVVLSLEALVTPIPTCSASSSCASSRFDLASRACVETMVPDGVPCDPQSVCILNATCQAGRCVGEVRTCDDQNACTLDVCNSQLGCEFVPAPPCPGDGKCMKGTCDPKAGCGLLAMEDGATCGSVQTCRAAQICIEGQCVTRDPPDGYICAQASPCQEQGICIADQCVRAPATALTPRWTFDAATVDGGADPPQLHDFVMEPAGAMTLGGFFQAPMVLRANTLSPIQAPQGASRRCILWGARLVCADYPQAPNGRVTALDLSTGSAVWTYDVRTQRPDFVALSNQIFLARLVVQGSDRMAALFEAYPQSANQGASTQCRRYFLVTLDATGQAVHGQRVMDPLLDECNHPHPYGVASDSVGNLFIAFSPTASQQAPLKPDKPTLLLSYTRDGVFRWKRTEESMVGGELAVARGLLYPENGSLALKGGTGETAFALPQLLGRVVISQERFIPAPVQGMSSLAGYEAGVNSLRWTHALPAGMNFWSDQIRLAQWTIASGARRTVALTFVSDGANPLAPIAIRAVHVTDGSEAFTCPLLLSSRTTAQLFEMADGSLGLMEGAKDGNDAPACGKCDPPFAGSSAVFRQYLMPGLSVPEEPWLGTFGGPSHDHREETPGSSGTN